jgi:hypothetical protein
MRGKRIIRKQWHVEENVHKKRAAELMYPANEAKI